MQEETIYFNDIPVATRQNGQTYTIHADHLNTPRVISDSTNTIVWRWDSAPFGETLPDEDPDNNGITFTYNVRFPGQYYDQETGLHYNTFRDYSPAIGRYLQNDPISRFLPSRAVIDPVKYSNESNYYEYAYSNPVINVDPSGLIAGRNSIEAAVYQAVLRGNMSEVKFLLENVASKNFSPAQKLLLRKQCQANAKRIEAGTLDVKLAERNLVESLNRVEAAKPGTPTPKTTLQKVVEFVRVTLRFLGF